MAPTAPVASRALRKYPVIGGRGVPDPGIAEIFWTNPGIPELLFDKIPNSNSGSRKVFTLNPGIPV